ncbi:MAG: DUF1304 domain-containing protein [Arachnia sp.]
MGLGLVLAAVAGLLHCYIFYMESLAWTSRRVREIFGISVAEAQTTRLIAFNQGFYNLFLAAMTAVGIGLVILGYQVPGGGH